jgi:hypothetical protein
MIHVTIERQTEKSLEDAIQNYFREYHPAGYGTMVRSKGPSDHDTWIAHIIRAASCD